MSLFRIQEKTPEVYTSTSRDFQLIGRLYDCIINGIKFDTDSILDIINTDFIDSRLLKLLQTKLGFFSDKYMTDEDLRYILKAFPYVVKNKGSLKGIEQAVSIFLKINGIRSKVRIRKINKSLSKPYTIEISLNMSYRDTTILSEILKYILPTGYNVEFKFIYDIGDLDLLLESKIGINVVVIKDSLSSLVRGNYIEYKNPIENYLIGSVGETQISSPNDVTYMGTLTSGIFLPNYFDDPYSEEVIQEHIGEVYIIKPQKDSLELDDQDRTILNRGSISYFMFTGNESDHYSESWPKGWKCMNYVDDQAPAFPYRVYNSCVYGYYDIDQDLFYSSKSDSFRTITYTQQPTDLKIDGENPDLCSILPNYINSTNNYKPRHLFDYSSGYIWVSNEISWFNYDIKTYGVEIIGKDIEETVYIIPKNNLIIYRNADPQHNVREAIWTTSLSYDNKFIWNPIIFDKDIIDTFKEQANATIYGSPTSAIIIDTKDNYVYESEKSWYKDNQENWINIKRFEITGNPNDNAYIVPIYINNMSLTVSNDSEAWMAELNSFSDYIDEELNVLYIDKDTNNGYRALDNGGFERVMYFKRADNVYQISEDEFFYMIENGLIRPAFKDYGLIFSDKFNNAFLL